MASSSSAPPYFVRPISTRTTCAADGTAVLESIAAGRPHPMITWLRNGVPVDKRDSKHLAHHEADSGKCQLVISQVGDEDEGEYECRAKNRLGQVSCFGELYVENEVLESKSGLFILIDEGSQDDENSADEMGCKESISASEQIESIIEDLTMGDGSLNLSMSGTKEGGGGEHLISETDDHEDLPLDENYRHFKSKPLRSIDEGLRDKDIFEDAEEEVFRSGKVQSGFGRQNLALHLHKVSGVEENLHRAFEDDNDCGEEDSATQDQDFECVRTAEVGGKWGFQTQVETHSKKSDCVSNQNFSHKSSRDKTKTKDKSGEGKFGARTKAKTTRGNRSATPKSEPLTVQDAEEKNDETCHTRAEQFDGVTSRSIECGKGQTSSRHSETKIGKGKPSSITKVEADLLRDVEIPAENRPKEYKTADSMDDHRHDWVASSRRNTTDCVEPRQKEKTKMVRQRSHSDGKSPAGEFEFGNNDRDQDGGGDSPQMCPWESLEKIWRDSLPTESGDDPLPSDVEIGNDEVFLDHSREDTVYAEPKYTDWKKESQHPRYRRGEIVRRPGAKMSYSRSSRSVSSRSYQSASYSYTSSDGYAEQSVGFSRVTSSIGGDVTNGSQTKSINVAYSEANYDTDDSRSEPVRQLTLFI